MVSAMLSTGSVGEIGSGAADSGSAFVSGLGPGSGPGTGSSILGEVVGGGS